MSQKQRVVISTLWFIIFFVLFCLGVILIGLGMKVFSIGNGLPATMVITPFVLGVPMIIWGVLGMRSSILNITHWENSLEVFQSQVKNRRYAIIIGGWILLLIVGILNKGLDSTSSIIYALLIVFCIIGMSIGWYLEK